MLLPNSRLLFQKTHFTLRSLSALVAEAEAPPAASTSARRKPKSSTEPKIRLAPMPTTRDLIKLYKLSAIKQLSQNFLLDEKLTNKIVRKGAGEIEGCYVCEVGPGPGSITRSIINKGAKRVIVIEIDKRFKNSLELLQDHVDIVWGDVLSFNMSKLFPPELRKEWTDKAPRIHLIGNLPFNVSTPLIIRWLHNISTQENAWTYGRVPLTLTFQLEVAERMIADVNDAQRCRLSIMTQTYCKVFHKFTIKGNAFVPRPDVDVGVVKFIPHKEPLIKQPFKLIEKVVRHTFSMRQKYCRRPLSTLFPKSVRAEFTDIMFEETEINPETRPFQLSIEEFGRLCDAYAKILRHHPSLAEYNYRGSKPDEIWDELYGKEFQDDEGEEEDEDLVKKEEK